MKFLHPLLSYTYFAENSVNILIILFEYRLFLTHTSVHAGLTRHKLHGFSSFFVITNISLKMVRRAGVEPATPSEDGFTVRCLTPHRRASGVSSFVFFYHIGYHITKCVKDNRFEIFSDVYICAEKSSFNTIFIIGHFDYVIFTFGSFNV